LHPCMRVGVCSFCALRHADARALAESSIVPCLPRIQRCAVLEDDDTSMHLCSPRSFGQSRCRYVLARSHAHTLTRTHAHTHGLLADVASSCSRLVVHSLVLFHPDPSVLQLFSCSVDGAIRWWSLGAADSGAGAVKGKGLLAVLDGHNSLVTGLSFAPNDATTLVSGGRDGVVLIWKLHQPGVRVAAVKTLLLLLPCHATPILRALPCHRCFRVLHLTDHLPCDAPRVCSEV
jgi:hypothetical protein